MSTLRILALALAALVGGALLTSGCVQSRPARNGVFNENVYLRKDFLVRPGDLDANGNPKPDGGWVLKATVVSTSSPNPLGGLNLWPGIHNLGALVRFRATQDHLDLLDLRELSASQSAGRVPEVVNSWQATNVDLKYRVNLDGENTNFYEENQENPWQQREWVKLNLAKNDLSDIAALGTGFPDLLNHCASVGESASTLVPDSLVVDPDHDYLQWTVQLTVPVRTDLPECLEAYSPMWNTAAMMDRPNVVLNLMYSMVRANPSPSYQPLVVGEKDPIHHKYGPIQFIGVSRDENSGQLAARAMVMRFDPAKPIVWYFDQGFPDNYKPYFTGPGGIAEQTNAILEKAQVAARVSFKNFDEDLPADFLNDKNLSDAQKAAGRQFGDVRYNFLRWMSDKDMQDSYAGVTQFTVDPRTGESLSASIVFNDFAIKDYYAQRIDAFLQGMGASLNVNASGDWKDGPANCKDGDTMPIVAGSLTDYYAHDTLYTKMQEYLGKPTARFGPLGPADFIQPQDDDFFRAYFALLPYQIFADPQSNPYVVPEGGAGVLGPDAYWKMLADEAEFHTRAAAIDHGQEPFSGVTGPEGVKNASAFLGRLRALTENHRDLGLAKVQRLRHVKMDSPEAFSLESVIARDARHCINGHWETKDEWVRHLIDTYWTQVFWHEFGHALGLEHNFMASVDKPNFPTYKDGAGRQHYALNASSVMEYNATPDRVFWREGWAPYDRAAIGWIYANSAAQGAPSLSLSGQTSPTSPWLDPYGFDDKGKEIQFLRCSEEHLRYTPFCRMGDLGTTPSEIIANELANYEWQYNWRNFRVYRKFWNNARYADVPASVVIDMRRFVSTWEFDWSSGELADTFRRLGVKNPDANGSDVEYFSQLTNKFQSELSTANSMVAAFHKAIIQQGTGERPFATVYDKFFGDVTQQGIILDKLFAMQGWVGMWPTDNYDQNQAGYYIATYSGIGDGYFRAIAEDAVDSMVGGQYNVYPYFRPLAVVQFAMDTHDPSFAGRIEVRDWIGGQVFNRLDDFLTYFRNLAVQSGACADLSTCSYDPRTVSDNHNEFSAPDKRVWIWAYVPDRNQYVAVQKDRNTASYVIVRTYNDDVVAQLDDGSFPGSAYSDELPIKFFLDSFVTYR